MWEIVYKRAIEDDGTLLFPERLTHDFLSNIRKSQGSYIFSNQYQNVIIPDEERRFRGEWIKYYGDMPEPVHNYGFIDPAIGQRDHNDYTGVTVVSVDTNGHWYLIHANRYRWTPTQIVENMFTMCKRFSLRALGVEIVAYQEALLYFVSQEMQKRDQYIPVHGVTRKSVSKESRILGLVPRFEWGGISIKRGLDSFEDEFSTFPRGEHDDILDSLASIDELITIPSVKGKDDSDRIENPHDPEYERQVIRDLVKRQRGEGEDDEH